MNKFQTVFVILLAGFLFSSTVAAERPSWYPPDHEFRLIGVVDGLTSNTIYIDDNKILLSPTVKVATEKSSNARLQQVKIGQLVGVKISKISKDRYLVDAIWVIPENERINYRPN